MPRVFLGIALPRVTREAIAVCRQALIDADPSWRSEKWVADDNLHVTLKFLGCVDDREVDTIARVAAEACASVPAYNLCLDELRAVPRARAASMLWVGGSDGHDETALLAGTIEGALAEAGYELDERTFKTHVTVCRARRPHRITADALLEAEGALRAHKLRVLTVSVRRATLYASTLTPHGPVYEELARLPLAE